MSSWDSHAPPEGEKLETNPRHTTMRPELKSTPLSEVAVGPAVVAQPHAVRSVRDTLRRWWGIELGFAGAGGIPEAGSKAIPILRENRLCNACLEDAEGGRRCVESIARAAGGKTGLAGPCHLGLDIAVAHLPSGGAFFACGFV